jgi:uncharacterized protein (DUF1800 family)
MKDSEPGNKLLHLYRRTAMGYLPEKDIQLNRAIDKLFKDSEHFVPIQLASFSDTVTAPKSTDQILMMGEMGKDTEKREMRRLERERVRDLNMAWVERMANDPGTLREHMSLFWHGHFACRSQNPVFVQSYLNTIRKNALGSFADLLMGVSREAAMLQFLNNQQNRKNSPNENFAREVMELFTVGRGNYTEADVKEGARAFTGWSYNALGEFEFRERNHDHGVKNFLGRQGAFEGADIIAILLEQRQTARFITEKIYRSFVSEVPDETRIARLASDFYDSKYDISALLRKIFSADWFYESSAQNVLIKSPVELLVGIQRTLGASFKNKQSTLYIQRVLGQELLYPPNVAGWPGGRNWIDSSSLMFRMQLPYMMIEDKAVKVKVKESGDVNDTSVKAKDKNVKAEVNWNKWAERFEKYPPEKLPESIASRLLARQPEPEVMELVIKKAASETDRVIQIKKITLAIMGLPEYQVS